MKSLPLFIFFLLLYKAEAQSDYFISSTDGIKLHVLEIGKGEPVILLAGGPGLNAIYMKGVYDTLSTRLRCIVLDQRGTGKSILPTVDSASLTMDDYADDIEALRMHLHLDQMNIIGHSWGAMLAMQYTSMHPDRVKKLILLDPGGPTSQFLNYFEDNLMSRLHDEDLREQAHLDSLHESDLPAIWPGYFFDRKRALVTKSQIDFSHIHGQPGVNGFTFKNYINAEPARLQLLKTYKGPAWIIQGRQDLIGESTAFEIKEYLPQTKIHFIEKAGHFPWLENVEQVNEFFELVVEVLK